MGGAVAVNALFGGPLSADELVACALRGEAAASGAAHADNVAPSVYGGIVLVRRHDPLDLIRLPAPAALRIVVVHPHAAVETAAARRLVAERRFEVGRAVANLGDVAALVHALHAGDLALLGRSVNDALVEPIRAPLVPGFAEVRRAAMDAGALGCSISGSGPSVFAFAGSDAAAHAAGEAMQAAFAAAGAASDRYVSPAGAPGAPRPIALVPVGDGVRHAAMQLARDLRRSGFVVDLGYRGNVTRRMKRADRIGARAALLLGEDELARGAVTLRDLDSGDQREVARDALEAALEALERAAP